VKLAVTRDEAAAMASVSVDTAYIGASGILPGLKPACNSRPNRARAAVGATTKRRQNLLARSFRRSGGGRNG
jgi:hypothetical protein